jgi:hypothetical protein
MMRREVGMGLRASQARDPATEEAQKMPADEEREEE